MEATRREYVEVEKRAEDEVQTWKDATLPLPIFLSDYCMKFVRNLFSRKTRYGASVMAFCRKT